MHLVGIQVLAAVLQIILRFVVVGSWLTCAPLQDLKVLLKPPATAEHGLPLWSLLKFGMGEQ